MKKINFLILCVVLLILLNIGTLGFLFYGHPRGGNERRPPPGNDPAAFIVDKLKLDKPQQEKFKELRDKHHQMMRDVQEEDKRLHDAYFNLLKSDDPDKRQVDSLANLVASQQKTLATMAFNHFMQLRAICHDDQKKIFDETIDEITRVVAEGRPAGRPPR